MDDTNPQSPSAAETHPVVESEEELSQIGGVDIIVHSLFTDGYSGHDFKINSKSQLLDFLNSVSLPDAPSNQYLLLIEDISPEVIHELSNRLHIQADIFDHHTKGRLNGDDTQQTGSVLHAQKLGSTLLSRASARKDNYSLTWWKLLTHSLAGYTYEREALTESDADATKVVVPHFSVHISDTRRKVGSTKNQTTQVKSGFKEFVRQWKKTQDETEMIWHSNKEKSLVERREETVCKLYCNTYRPHQVISEVERDRWGSAGEERLTYVKASMNGSTFCNYNLYPAFLALNIDSSRYFPI